MYFSDSIILYNVKPTQEKVVMENEPHRKPATLEEIWNILRAVSEEQKKHPTVKGRRHGEHYEYDILAANGEEVVVVEVKTTLRAGDVTHFLEKLDKFTGWVPEFKGRKVLGAVAYLKVDHSVEVYAERQGL